MNNTVNKRHTLPKIGARIMKSAAGVALCMVIYYLRSLFIDGGMPFYGALAALWCMQQYTDTTKNMAKQRLNGTFIGAVFGLIFLILRMYTFPHASAPVVYLVSSVMIIPIIYTTILANKRNASFFSCVVFLSIAINHALDTNPYIFVLDRVSDTLIGIAVGVGLNVVRIPRKYHNEVLYVLGIDEILVTSDDVMIPYNKIELNRLISRGARVTISTIRTPASLRSRLDGVNLKLPVIAMDGAVLYDTAENRYIERLTLEDNYAEKIISIIQEHKLHYFLNTLLDNTLIIYYGEFKNDAERDLFERLRRSPYRNYTNIKYRSGGARDDILYIMVLSENEAVDRLYKDIYSRGLDENVRITFMPAAGYEGYTYLKIYNKEASKDRMLKKLEGMTNPERIITFGSIKGKYDIYINDDGGNSAVKTLKKMYEPFFWEKDKFPKTRQ